MKLFKSTILAMLGMAVALTSCSDDDKYEPGNTQAGAYFVNASQTAYINDETSVFEVEVFRTPQGGNEYTLVAEDPSGLFSIPTTVTFAGSELSTKIAISCDPSKFEENSATEIKLSVGDPISYANNTTVVEVVKGYARVSQPFDNKKGTYIFAGYYSGYQPDVPVFKAYLPTTPDKDVNIVIGDLESDNPLYPGVELIVNIPDMTARDANGNIPVSVPSQYYTDNSDYGRVCVADAYTYYTVYIPSIGYRAKDEVIEDAKGKSFYNPESGLFTLNVIYYIPDYGTGTSSFGQNKEYFQLDGYPVYDVQIEYNGLFINRNEEKEARATVTCGEDVSKVRTYMVEGTDVDAAIEAIFADAEGVTIYNGQDEFQATFPITKGGTYTIVAISYDEAGEAQQLGYDSFQISLGATDNDDWADFGTADIADGWITGAFSISGVPIDVLDYMFSVPVQKYVGDQEFGADVMYRLVQPFGDDYFLAGQNAYPAKRNINFMIQGKYVAMEPQESGFGTASWKGEMTIGNWEGDLYAANEGVTVTQCANAVAGKEPEYVSSFEDGVVTIPLPMFGAPGLGNGSFGYNWTNIQSSLIVMPDADEAAAAKAKAGRVAAPKVQGPKAKATFTNKAVRTATKERIRIVRDMLK